MLKLVYRPSISRFVGKTRTYYIIYNETHVHDYKGKKKTRTQKRVKRIYISGKLKSWSRGIFVSRFGTRIHGVKFTYINFIPKGAGKSHKIKYMRITKIIPIPSNARSVKIRTSAPKGPRLDIT